MQNSDPAVTIGLPVYNGEAFVGRALQSILAQTMTDFELVISDNGSTDDTLGVIEEAVGGDPRVRLEVARTNQGAAWNFSHLVDEARAPLFKWAAHDDVLAPRMLELLLEATESNRNAVLWYSLTDEIDDDDNLLDQIDDRLPLTAAAPHQRLERLLATYMGSNPLFGLISTPVLRSTRRLDDFHSSDIVLLAELALRGPFHEVPEVLFHRRWEYRSTHVRDRQEVDEWFNPASTRHHDFRFTRLVREVSRSIARAGLDPREAARCHGVVARWAAHHWRAAAGEFKAAAKRRLGADVSIDY